MASRHKRASLEQNLEVFAKVLVTAGAATLTSASGELFEDADITFTNVGTGDYTVTINPLKLPAGEAYAFCTALCATAKLFAVVKTIAYSSDALAVRVNFFSDAGTATDPDSFFLHVFAC